MTRIVKKFPVRDVSPSTKTLTTSYGSGYVTDEFRVTDFSYVTAFLLVSNGWDGTSLELKIEVYNSDNDTWYSESRVSSGTAALDEITITDAAVFSTESDATTVLLDVRGHDRVRLRAKRTGGSAGDLTVHLSGG